eukprot:2441229-Pyramimonas_sp.AAC.1
MCIRDRYIAWLMTGSAFSDREGDGNFLARDQSRGGSWEAPSRNEKGVCLAMRKTNQDIAKTRGTIGSRLQMSFCLADGGLRLFGARRLLELSSMCRLWHA